MAALSATATADLGFEKVQTCRAKSFLFSLKSALWSELGKDVLLFSFKWFHQDFHFFGLTCTKIVRFFAF